ncbi:MAG: 3-carboxy-cis,cis-muconate cycloisomerase [Devosia sp.]
MTVSPLDHPLLSGLLGDGEIAAYFEPEAELAEIIRFERELLMAEEAEAVVPAGTGELVLPLLDEFVPNIARLREATARDGVIGVEFVRQLREWVGPPADQHVHFGATSQDLVDTALVLRLKAILPILEGRIKGLIGALDDLERRFGAQRLMARTRMQDALPIRVSDKLATWRSPLQRDLERLEAMWPRLLVLQFGGAAGTLDRLGDKGPAVARRLAASLGLGLPERPWHTQRDTIVEFAGWLALVSGSLGKIGADICLLAQNRVAEIAMAGGGGSSAMAFKSNPVGAEIMVALAHANAALAGGMYTAMVHEQERSGAAWTLEWLLLPQLLVGTGASLRTGLGLLGKVTSMGRAE